MSYNSNSLHHKIFETLRDRIIYLKYPPGMILSEKDLCSEFKVSRTPFREAIRKLEDMRLVTVIPRFGTHVSNIDINEIRCAFEVKIKLEGVAGMVAAKRITPDKLQELQTLIKQAEKMGEDKEHQAFIALDARFHEIIYEATQNSILQEMLENLHSRCARLWTSSLTRIIPIMEVAEQLKEIHAALRMGDGEKASQLMEHHVQHFVDKIKSQLL